MSEAPYVEEIKSPPAPVEALARFQHWPRTVLFHSAAERPDLGRYSFLSADPLESWEWRLSDVIGTSPKTRLFEPLRVSLETLGSQPVPDAPPFQGGLAGIIGYE